jgi:hypothetical protein
MSFELPLHASGITLWMSCALTITCTSPILCCVHSVHTKLVWALWRCVSSTTIQICMNKILNWTQFRKFYDNDAPHVRQIMGALGIFPGGGQNMLINLSLRRLRQFLLITIFRMEEYLQQQNLVLFRIILRGFVIHDEKMSCCRPWSWKISSGKN